jgi:Tfp pilus assembly protein PilE
MELLVVIVIIGVLSTIAVSVFWRTKSRGFEAAMQSDLKTASAQQEHYFEANHTYADDPTDLENFHASPGVELTITYAELDGWAGITSHTSATRVCGLLVGAAPAGIAGPATAAGLVECGDP